MMTPEQLTRMSANNECSAHLSVTTEAACHVTRYIAAMPETSLSICSTHRANAVFTITQLLHDIPLKNTQITHVHTDAAAEYTVHDMHMGAAMM